MHCKLSLVFTEFDKYSHCCCLCWRLCCCLLQPILEFASLVWAVLPAGLVQLVESVQISARRIIFPDCSYESALVSCGLPTLLARRDEACRHFISNIKESGFLAHLLPQPTNVAHGYGLKSGFSCSQFHFVRIDHLSKFVTHSYNRAWLCLLVMPSVLCSV